MKLQDTPAGCGPASLSNALAATGIARTQAECAVLCRTSATDGTSGPGMVRAVRALGLVPLVISETRGEVAGLLLDAALRAGHAAVLIVDNGAHWVATVGQLGGRYLVADPADTELVVSVDVETLMARWGAAEPGRKTRYYGVAV